MGNVLPELAAEAEWVEVLENAAAAAVGAFFE